MAKKKYNPDLRVLDEDAHHNTMKPRLSKSPKKFNQTSRNRSLKLGQSFFAQRVTESGIGEKLSPGRYKLLQGQPDMQKRNRSHFETFNEKTSPMTWRKKLVSKVSKRLLIEEKLR